MTLFKDFKKEVKSFNDLVHAYDLRTVDDFDYDFIAENEHVENVINNGISGIYPDKLWFTALGEGSGFDFYMKRGEE